MKGELKYLLHRFIEKLGYRINFDEFEFQFLSHPSYPSLHAVTGVLTHFGIENLALEVPVDINTLQQMPDIFLSVTSENKFVIAIQREESVELIFDDSKEVKVSKEEFLENWSGIVCAVDPVKSEELFKKDRYSLFSLKKVFYAFTSLFIVGFFYLSRPSVFEALHFTFSIIGIIISVLILRHELGYRSESVDNFCNGSKVVSCGEILNSEGAIFFKRFKLSDLSITYFLGLTIAWLITISFGATGFGIIVLSLLVVPVTAYSIYYQYQVAKKWCPLCLGIVGVLWLQVGSLFVLDRPLENMVLGYSGMLPLLSGFLISTSSWLFIKPLLIANREASKFKIDYFKFKRNFDFFQLALNKTNALDTKIHATNGKEITLGNVNAPIELLLVTSPLCYFCKAAHKDLELILKSHPVNIKAVIRFNTSLRIQGNLGYRVNSRLLQIYEVESQITMSNAIHDAYQDIVDLEKWIVKWGDVDTQSYDKILSAQHKWCQDNGVHFTPTLYVNGKEFPKEYERTDLIFFIDEMIEQSSLQIDENRSMVLLEDS